MDIERDSLLFVDQIVHAAEAVLRGTGYSLLLTFGTSGQEFEQRVRSMSGKVDGLLVAEEVMAIGDLRTLARRIPVVVIAGRRDEAELDVVVADNVTGMAAVVSHLVGHHRYHRLCFVTGPKDAPDARERQAAFEEAVLASRGSVIEQVIHGDFSEGSGTAAARVLLDRGSMPQAVVCANDQMAFGVLREFQRAGIAVPADVALTGFDDVYPSRVVDPPLTTVRQPVRDLGIRAAERLLARIGEPSLPPRADILPTTAVIRASCGCRPLTGTTNGAEGPTDQSPKGERRHAKTPQLADGDGDTMAGGVRCRMHRVRTRRGIPVNGCRRAGRERHHRAVGPIRMEHRVQR
jgi:LacI family transcriptional regulator